MNDKKNDNQSRAKKKTGPQGTQVFELDEVNKMIAKEIVASKSDNAHMPALIGVSNDVIGQQFILRKSKTEIGRRPSSDIVLTESSVSSMHAQIVADGDGWKVLNLLSSNGTFVNGKKIVQQPIVEGDMIGFAGSEFVFSLVEDDMPSQSKKSNNNLAVVGVVFAIAIALLIFAML